MVKTRIILVVVSIALIAGLFLLPKVVVENDNAISQNPTDSIAPKIEICGLWWQRTRKMKKMLSLPTL